MIHSIFSSLQPHNISKHDYTTHSITLSPLHKLIDQIGLSFANNLQHNFSVCVSGLSNIYERKSISSTCFNFFSHFFFLSLHHTISLSLSLLLSFFKYSCHIQAIEIRCASRVIYLITHRNEEKRKQKEKKQSE